MNHVLKNNEKTLRALNNMIAGGFYTGIFKHDEFEFKRLHFPNNIRITGSLNSDNYFDVEYSYIIPLNFLSKLLLILGVILSVISVLNQNLILPAIFIVTTLISYFRFKFRGGKELEKFMKKVFEFSENEV